MRNPGEQAQAVPGTLLCARADARISRVRPWHRMAGTLLLSGVLGTPVAGLAQPAGEFAALENPPSFQADDDIRSVASGQATLQASATEAQLPPARQRSVRLDVDYVNSYIWNPLSGRYDRVRLRSYHGRSGQPLVAPTINLQPGTTLNVLLSNHLSGDDPSCRQLPHGEHNTPHCFNSTNLHTHGLWVDPNGISDNIFLNIKPGGQQKYRIHVPHDHPAGTFWYHSHLHGSTALQVSSGMAGALIIRGNRLPTARRHGDLDTLLQPTRQHRVQERIMVLQQIQYACRDENGGIKTNADGSWRCDANDVGGIENYDVFSRPSNWRDSGRFTTINGRTLPVFVGARAGRFERWRMIHAGVRDTIRLQIRQARLPWNGRLPNTRHMNAAQLKRFVNEVCTGKPLPQHLVAADGLTMNAMQRTESTVFQPGYRWDALMMFPRAGYYCVLDAFSPANGSVNGVPVQQLLGMVSVSPGMEMNDEQIPAYVRYQMERLARDNMPASSRAAVIADLRDGLKLTRFTQHETISTSELTESAPETVTFNIGGSGAATTFEIDGGSYKPGQVDRYLKLGAVQEWHLKSQRGGHPFHIHVNPFQIVAILDPSGRDVSGFDVPDDAGGSVDTQYRGLKGVWKDTIFVKAGPGGNAAQGQYTVITRTRYQRYIGDFVLHCHILNHEDQGMMQHVRIHDPARPQTRTAPAPGHH